MADNKEPWDEPTKREPRERAAAVSELMRFYREISNVQIECGTLCAALERRDVHSMELAADRLAAASMVASTTIRVVEAAPVDLPHRQVAELALRSCHEVVARLFALTCQMSEDWGIAALSLPLLVHAICKDIGLPIVNGKPSITGSCEADAFG